MPRDLWGRLTQLMRERPCVVAMERVDEAVAVKDGERD